MTSETETKKMKITKVSQELFVEAIKTFPVDCSNMEFRMYAKTPDFPIKDDSEERYVSECLENNIIPFSLVEFRYRQDKGLFVPDDFRIYHDKISESIQKLLEGGKFNQVEIKNYTDSCAAFEEFRKENGLLDLMLSKNYKLSSGDIEGNYGNSNLIFFAKYMGRKRLELVLGYKLADEGREKLVGWFKELEDKYQHKQGKLI